MVEQIPDEALVVVAAEGEEKGWRFHRTHPQVRSRLIGMVMMVMRLVVVTDSDRDDGDGAQNPLPDRVAKREV